MIMNKSSKKWFFVISITFVLTLFIYVLIHFSIISYAKKSSTTFKGNSVSMYGAVGDGITDDRNALQAALDNSVGKTLYFPAGTYMISNAIYIPSNITIIGEDDAIIIAGPDYGLEKDVLRTDLAQNITINNLTISGNIASNTREKHEAGYNSLYLFDIFGCDNITLKNCTFIDNVCPATRLIFDCKNVTYDSCTFLNVDCGVIFLGTGDVSNLTVNSCYFDGHKNSEPVSFWGLGNYTNISILNNTIVNKTYGTAINVTRGNISHITIAGNNILNDSCGVDLKFANDVEVANNRIESTGNAISVTGCSNIKIHDNIIQKTRRQGIYIKDSSDILFSNNNVSDCGSLGNVFHSLDLIGNCQQINIINNTFSRTDKSFSDSAVFINCSGSVNIENNNFMDCKFTLYNNAASVTATNN